MFAFILLVSGVAGVDLLSNNPSILQGGDQPSSSSEFQNIAITIHDRNTSQPIEGVEIQIIFDGPPVAKMTDRNGYVSINIPARDSVQLILTHQGYETARETINLRTDPDTNRILYLDSKAP